MKYNTPLLYKLVERLDLPPKLGVEDLYKRLVREMRSYGVDEIVKTSLASLSRESAGKDDLMSFPWLTMLVAKWALQAKSVPMRIGKAMPQERLDVMKNALWNAPSNLEGINPQLLVRSHMYAQLQFQRVDILSFIRWPALIARSPANSEVRSQFRRVVSMEPEEYIDLTFALSGAIARREFPLSPKWLDALRSHYPTQIDALLHLFSRDLLTLRSELQLEEAHKIRGKTELLEFPYFKRFPLLRTEAGLYSWHPKVFAQGMEDAIDIRMSKLGQIYTQNFGKIFEEYVIELGSNMAARTFAEREYKRIFGKDKNAVELLIPGVLGNVFIEAKVSLYADEVMLTDSIDVIKPKTKRLREAIGQCLKVGTVIRQTHSEGALLSQSDRDYLIIVTSRDLLISGGKMLMEMYGEGQWDPYGGDSELRKRLPPENIFILSIGDFEKFSGIVANGSVDLWEILTNASKDNRDPMTSKLLFADHVGDVPWVTPTMLTSALERSANRLAAALNQPPLVMPFATS